MNPSKIVIEVDAEGEILLLRNSLGERLDFSVELGTGDTTHPDPTTTQASSAVETIHDRHTAVVQPEKKRKADVEKFLSPNNYVLSYPTHDTVCFQKYPDDCAWFFRLQDKPDENGLRANTFYECTSMAKISHVDSTCAFTDEYFQKKLADLRDACAGHDDFGKSYPGIICHDEHIEKIRQTSPFLVENDLLIKQFDEDALRALRPCLHETGYVQILKHCNKNRQEYYILVKNRLPCFINDQIRLIVKNNALNQTFESFIKSEEFQQAKRVAITAQEKLFDLAAEHFTVLLDEKENFCHTLTNLLRETTLPKNNKKKCATFASGCFFSDDWKQGSIVRVGNDLGFLHLSGPDNGTDEFGAGWHNKFGDTVPGCLYAKKKTIDLLKQVNWNPEWGLKFFEILKHE